MNNIAEKVMAILMDCLFERTEPADSDVLVVDGIVRKFGLHPERLESHRQEVKDILREMPRQFFKVNGGGGWSFLNLCNDKNGNQWGEHLHMEALVVLAIGLKLGRYCLPRNMWNVFPGGMPYVEFDV